MSTYKELTGLEIGLYDYKQYAKSAKINYDDMTIIVKSSSIELYKKIKENMSRANGARKFKAITTDMTRLECEVNYVYCAQTKEGFDLELQIVREDNLFDGELYA